LSGKLKEASAFQLLVVKPLSFCSSNLVILVSAVDHYHHMYAKRSGTNTEIGTRHVNFSTFPTIVRK